MSYAIYAESNGYVHLVSASTPSGAFELLSKDLLETGVQFKELLKVYACKDGGEFPDLEDLVKIHIKNKETQ